MDKRIMYAVSVLLSVSAALFGSVAYAALSADSKLTQAVTGGTISTDVRNASNAIVASPSFAMTAITASTGTQVATGTFGSGTQRISVDNPGGANNGWNLSLNAKVPGTSKWTSGADTYMYNGTSVTGQLTINPSAGTLTQLIGTATGITKSGSGAFTSTTPITLLTAAVGSDDIWNGYLTGVSLSQAIPAGQAVGNYSIDMTQTVAAT